MITKKELSILIEPHLFKNFKNTTYEIISVQANKLLTHTRLDLGFKLLYLDLLTKNVSYAKEIYKQNIGACNFGKFIEIGNNEKNSFRKFVVEFEKTFKSIQKSGFNSNISLIPLSENGSIANGAHRIASAIYCNKTVDTVQIDTDNEIQDYNFFYKRNIPSSTLDAVVTKFIEYASNVHIAFLWPIGGIDDKTIDEIIPNIVYVKMIKLNYNGAHNLLSQVYYGEEWLGDVKDGFKGARGKLVECFKNFNSFKVIAFQAENLEKVKNIKDKIRGIYNVGKHSVHITDSKKEVIRTAGVVFNDNSIHFLNYGKPNKYISIHDKIDEFKNFANKNNISTDDMLIDSSCVLSCYGLREAKDIDFFCSDNSKIKIKFENINIHDEELKYYGEEKNELIYNPKNHFYFNDIKFISFNLLYRMKKNRSEYKDQNDCNMMDALIDNNQIKKNINRLKQSYFYGKIKLRQNLMNCLKGIGLYNVSKIIFNQLKVIKK
jgi:hypothetical protein